jgi:hypothetical protein
MMGRVDLAGKLSDARARVAAEAPLVEAAPPMFAQLARKDARIRDDQVTALAALADALMRRRRFKAERITENTLIRIAIDLLLAHADRLRGSTEDELRNSVASAVPKSATSAVPDSGPSGATLPGAAMLAPATDTAAHESSTTTPKKFGTSDVRDSGGPGPCSIAGSEGWA